MVKLPSDCIGSVFEEPWIWMLFVLMSWLIIIRNSNRYQEMEISFSNVFGLTKTFHKQQHICKYTANTAFNHDACFFNTAKNRRYYQSRSNIRIIIWMKINWYQCCKPWQGIFKCQMIVWILTKILVCINQYLFCMPIPPTHLHLPYSSYARS